MTEDDNTANSDLKVEEKLVENATDFDNNVSEVIEEENPEIVASPQPKRKRSESPIQILPPPSSDSVSQTQYKNVLIEAQAEYFRRKDRREEQRELREQEEHKLRLEQMRLNIQKTTLEIEALQNINSNVL